MNILRLQRRSIAGIAVFLLLSGNVTGCRDVSTETDLSPLARVENGVLYPPEGYRLDEIDSPDSCGGKAAALINAGTNQIEGTWFCGCSDTSSDSAGCRVTFSGGGMSCNPTVCKRCTFMITIDTLHDVSVLTR